MQKYKAGIIGGMGPAATVELFRQIVDNTNSKKDNEHIHVFIDNNTSIPDRTSAIIGNGNSPLPKLVESAQGLEHIGANFLAIPCNTSHYYLDEIQKSVNIELINMIEVVAKKINRLGFVNVGLLATTGTIVSDVYKNMLDKHNIKLIVPEEQDQEEVMKFIYEGVKAGTDNFDMVPIEKVIDSLNNRGAQTIILGCTEFSVEIDKLPRDNFYIDALHELAIEVILKTGYNIKN